jgi:hypothetical protein
VTYVVGTTYESSFRTKHALPSGFFSERIALPWRLNLSAWDKLWCPTRRPVGRDN